ncbi:uncharacterized protein PHACADRAFT_264153 [Phanerochaete carnosa HHB-10118-sp]|uniref:DNA polymerase delta subunit 4 n=1 Tax=Phanerochaete carnosa (strain HHB-10118-sp) TaxID=650164 RepID=K5WKC4_PHACS|nr:uncharacterized protein PHACADRAFT_264153 [Phanerochaete carnosa HHB-10118-sp]EKM50717.1 hypothetical protein PHACADRAFT_264153 [Phanerochaete carnosa HHB-10118-sp]
MARRTIKPKILKQTSLSFPAKRSNIASGGKEKQSQSSASATPLQTTADISDVDDVTSTYEPSDLEEVEHIATLAKEDDEAEQVSDSEPERTLTSRTKAGKRAAQSVEGKEKEEEDGIEDEGEEKERPKKKRRVSVRVAKSAAASIEVPPKGEESFDPSAKKGKGKRTRGKKSLAKSVFGSREGVENSEGNREADWATESKKIKITAKGNGKGAVAKHVDVLKMREYFSYVRAQQGNVKPIHAQNHSMEDHILRFFDLSYQYGPCIGVSRLQRWGRAEALGLSPPGVVKQLLTNEDGTERVEVKECVFFGEV